MNIPILDDILGSSENPNFELELEIDGKLFSRKILTSKGATGGLVITIRQRREGVLSESFHVSCYADKEGRLSTIVASQERTRLKVVTNR
jgi:hypothetical protein